MKHSQTIAIDRRGISRGYYSDERAIEVNLEASRIAWNTGDEAEAKARQQTADDIERKRKRKPPPDAYELPLWLLAKLGRTDAIAVMLKSRELTVVHGKAAVMMREFLEWETSTFGGGGEPGMFVDGGKSNEMIDHVFKRRRGMGAWDQALGVTDMKARRATEMAIRGRINLTRCARMIGGDTTTARKTLSVNVKRALDALAAYLGAVD